MRRHFRSGTIGRLLLLLLLLPPLAMGQVSNISGGNFTGGTILTPIGAANGTVAAPTYSFSGSTSTGIWLAGGPGLTLDVGGVSQSSYFSNLGRNVSTLVFGWSSGDPTSTALDIGFARNAIGVVEVNTGTAGTYAGIKARTARFAQTTPPTVTAACGGTPTVTGSDGAFQLNVGTGGIATTCTVTFNVAWGFKPVCVVSDETSQAITTTAVPASATIVFTATAAWTASSILDVICVGNQ